MVISKIDKSWIINVSVYAILFGTQWSNIWESEVQRPRSPKHLIVPLIQFGFQNDLIGGFYCHSIQKLVH